MTNKLLFWQGAKRRKLQAQEGHTKATRSPLMLRKLAAMFLLLFSIGISSAWGTCALYGGTGGNTFISNIADDGQLPSTAPEVAGWTFTGAWCTTRYGGGDPTTSYPSESSYVHWQGAAPIGTTMYAIYSRVCTNTYYCGAPYECYDISLWPTSGDSYATASEYCNIAPGTSITITAYPATGKSVTNWSVYDEDMQSITPTSSSETTFTFEMPHSDVGADLTFGDPCTARTVTFANNITRDYGTSAAKFQNYTLSAGSGTITWSSDDEDIATVDNSGVVTIHKAGWTYINVEVANDGTYCEVSDWYKLTINALVPTLSSTTSGKELTVSGITHEGATFSGGIVTSKGDATIKSHGYIVGTSADVTYATRITQAGTNTDVELNTAFESKTVTGLEKGTTYYVRPIANNKDQIGYGTAVAFTTLDVYDITLDKNNSDAGSEGGLATIVENSTSMEYIAPTRTGYTVEGYYTDEECTLANKIATAAGALQPSISTWTNSSSEWVKGSGATFYTKWSAKTYSISFNQNGGSGGSSNATATYGAAMPSATMPTTPPTGKEFAGYYYNSVQYYDKDGNSVHNWDVDGEITLTASWTTPTPTIEVVANSHVTISSTTPSIIAGSSATYTSGSTVTLSHGDPASGYYWGGWNVYETGSAGNTVTVTNDQFTMPNFNVTVSAKVTSDYKFSCATLTLTGPSGDTVFITSAADMKVRSQEAFHVQGNGLTSNTPITFAISDPTIAGKFAFLTATGGALATDANGEIDTDFYVFYTPDGEDDEDGLDKFTTLTASVAGGKPRTSNTLTTKTVIGRHLPANFVIAAKRNDKWYALPSDMTTGTPSPVEIAVDDIDNPSVAYTAISNNYSLYQQHANQISSGDGQYVKLAMQGQSNAPLFGSSSTAPIGKSTATIVTNEQTEGYWWLLVQTYGVVNNPEEAKYRIYCANHSTHHLRLAENSGDPKWGLYASGIEELRLIPADASIGFAEAEIVEWGEHGAIVEVDAEGGGFDKVKAKLNGEESGLVKLNQTLTSVKNAATKYDYTVNFGVGMNFARLANAGKMLTLEWYDNKNALKAISNIVMPIIVAETATINSTNFPTKSVWNKEVHVLPGDTLKIDAHGYSKPNVTIKELHIYPGATVKVVQDTLLVTRLILRNGWTRVGEKRFDAARLYINPEGTYKGSLKRSNKTDVWYSDWYIDYDQYYPVAVPWKVKTTGVTGITYKNTKSSAEAGVTIRYYDGSQRAGVSGVSGATNWVAYTWGSTMPDSLAPGTGYVMTAKRPKGKAFSIVRMPLTVPSAAWMTAGELGNVGAVHKDQVNVGAYTTASTPEYAKGWNFIGNPYMAVYRGALNYTESGNIQFATIPTEDFRDYYQAPFVSTNLNPGSAFFVQAPKDGTVVFGTANRRDKKASYRNELQQDMTEVQYAYIELGNSKGSDMMGLLIGDTYSEAYETNADLTKILGDANTVKTYMNYSDMNLAYVAINETLAKNWIPVTVKIPAAGEYTFSLSNFSTVDALEGVYLIDFANGNKVTNLIEEDYTFSEVAGTNSERFALNAIVGERQTPTDVDATNGGTIDPDKAIKFMYREKVYILYHGEIYDSTGKKVK